MAISNERFTTLFLNWWEIEEKDMTLSEMQRYYKDIGMTRAEFIELITQSNEFISKDGWAPEPEANEKVSTETGEGVFWKEYNEKEEVSVGDSDQAIFETALTQIGIGYHLIDNNRLEIKTSYYNTIEIQFNDKGDFVEICV